MKKAIEQPPKTFGDLLSNVRFVNILSHEIKLFEKFNSSKYVANPVKILSVKGYMNYNSFIKLYVSIIDKKCDLSVRERDLIYQIVQLSIRKTMNYYQQSI